MVSRLAGWAARRLSLVLRCALLFALALAFADARVGHCKKPQRLKVVKSKLDGSIDISVPRSLIVWRRNFGLAARHSMQGSRAAGILSIRTDPDGVSGHGKSVREQLSILLKVASTRGHGHEMG